ncbi:unnamed protein product, partial [Adineta ricciae]
VWFKNRRAKYRKKKREATDRCRRETLDKSQRTDGESIATGSSTPSANSSSSLSSVGHEPTANNDHSSSTSHNLVVGCSTTSISAANSTSSRSDLSPGISSAHSPTYAQQPLALTTSNTRLSNGSKNNHDDDDDDDDDGDDDDDDDHTFANPSSRKETFPINHIRQQQQSPAGPYVKF